MAECDDIKLPLVFQSGWSFRELKPQVASGLYERLALRRAKEGVRQLANEGQVIVRPEDIFKEPYVLEFLGLIGLNAREV
jgi:predicted nuclease of restriction endonuclease-like (RecB) superfamily